MNKEKDDFFLHSNEVNHINRENYDKIELLVNAAKAFARSTYQCVYIIDYFHQDFIYASDNLAYLCGLEPEQLMEAGYQMYIDHVPDADLQMLLEVNKKGFDLFNELPVGDRLDYTISYDFHLTNGRHSRLIHHHLTPILLSDDGRIWLALCTVSLAATDEPGHIIMQKNGERSFFEYSTLRHKWEKKEGITLSETERDVLRLSAQGYTMNDIADRLCKSVDTIKACKRNLFAKMNIKLVDFKIEFGRTSDGEIVLADEVSPDTCRLWDMTTNEKLDKDRFRRDLGKVREAYEEILARLQKIVG